MTGFLKFGALSVVSLFFLSVFIVFIIPVLAQHTSSVEITPTWVDPGVEYDFTVGVEHSTGSDPIREVRIYNNTPGHTDFLCGPAPSGWDLNDQSGKYNYCQYQTGDSYIHPGETLNFTFEAKMTEEECSVDTCIHYFRTATIDIKEPEGDVYYNYPEVYVDCFDPVTVKTYGDPKYPADMNEGAAYPHWISTSTPITLTATDNTSECDSGVKVTMYRDFIVRGEGEMACRDESYCHPEYYGDPDIEFMEYEGPFRKETESCHILEYYSIDNVGNREGTQYQCVFVDDTAPELWKVHDEGMIEGYDPELGTFHWMTQDMEITLFCEDVGPHPVNEVSLWYRTWNDITKVWTDWKDTNGQVVNKTIKFGEDSVHKIQYYCEDALGNSNGTRDAPYEQVYKVDSEPPIINKTMVGKWLGDCPPEGDDVCYVADDSTSGITVSVVDGGDICAIDRVECLWNYYWNGRWWEGDEFHNYTEIIFDRDSTHTVRISCRDGLGNNVTDEETFLVDSMPPITTKIYGEPYKVDPVCRAYYESYCDDGPDGECGDVCHREGCVEYFTHKYCTWWITPSTPVTLITYDEKVGQRYNSTTYWRNLYFPDNDEICYNDTLLGDLGTKNGYPVTCHPEYYSMYVENYSEIEWNVYEGEFFNSPESCHVIEYKSVDALGNEEEPKWQCVFVDDTPPISVKEHEGMIIPDDGFSWVRQDTDIILDCIDQSNHPVGQETMCYKVSLDDYGLEYLTEAYCEEFGGTMNDEDYCCVYVGEDAPNLEIHFLEDSYHNLEYYCVDHLGNDERDTMGGEPNMQWYKVDSTPPRIEKTVVGPQIGDCPPEGDEECYIKGNITEIHVNVTDGGEICAVDEVDCYWWYYLDGDIRFPSSGVYGLDGPIIFAEDTVHELHIKCKDALGNEMKEDIETFFVDSTPPVTRKWYEGPRYPHEGYPMWINNDTKILFSAEDVLNKPCTAGGNTTYYMITLLDNDEMCENQELCEPIHTYDDAGWMIYDPENPPTDIEDSCHMIEYYSEDLLENREEIRAQCVFVDNKEPIPNKTLGEPKSAWDGLDANFYDLEEFCMEPGKCWKITMLTPIDLACDDQLPHPVDHETVCFKVELDAEDATSMYCNEYYDGDYNESGDGFCCLAKELETPFYFNEVSEHNLAYYCVDALGNRGPIDDEKFKVEETAFEIQINRKWNLISVPVRLLDDSMDEVFKDVSDTVKTVWTYDSELDEWYVYTPDGNPANDNLHTMLPGWGYWLLADGDDMLIIGGSLFSPATVPPSKPIVKGWNLIGYYGAEGQPGYYGPTGNGKNAFCELFSLGESWFDKGYSTILGYWEPYNTDGDPDTTPFIEYDRMSPNMDPGAGYWIYSLEDGMFVPPTACDP